MASCSFIGWPGLTNTREHWKDPVAHMAVDQCILEMHKTGLAVYTLPGKSLGAWFVGLCSLIDF